MFSNFLKSIAMTLAFSAGLRAQLPLNEVNYANKTLYPATALLYSQTESGGMEMRCTATAIEKTETSYTFSRNFLFNLDKDTFRKLVTSSCYFCGEPPCLHPFSGRLNGGVIANGTDRLDSTQGYVDKNCVACCPMCNRAKSNHDLKVFLLWLSRAGERAKELLKTEV